MTRKVKKLRAQIRFLAAIARFGSVVWLFGYMALVAKTIFVSDLHSGLVMLGLVALGCYLIRFYGSTFAEDLAAFASLIIEVAFFIIRCAWIVRRGSATLALFLSRLFGSSRHSANDARTNLPAPGRSEAEKAAWYELTRMFSARVVVRLASTFLLAASGLYFSIAMGIFSSSERVDSFDRRFVICQGISCVGGPDLDEKEAKGKVDFRDDGYNFSCDRAILRHYLSVSMCADDAAIYPSNPR
jgi:hypothetical protein